MFLATVSTAPSIALSSIGADTGIFTSTDMALANVSTAPSIALLSNTGTSADMVLVTAPTDFAIVLSSTGVDIGFTSSVSLDSDITLSNSGGLVLSIGLYAGFSYVNNEPFIVIVFISSLHVVSVQSLFLSSLNKTKLYVSRSNL